jgi:hypothetical protein
MIDWHTWRIVFSLLDIFISARMNPLTITDLLVRPVSRSSSGIAGSAEAAAGHRH